MRSDVLFVSVILPCAVMIIGWIGSVVHDRWVDREIAREKAAAARQDG